MTAPSVWREEFQQVEIESTVRFIGDARPAGKKGAAGAPKTIRLFGRVDGDVSDDPRAAGPRSCSRLAISARCRGIMFESLPLLAVAVLVVALLYSSVGHAGASGYLAVMSLFSLAPEVIKPTALMLNVLVAGIGAWQFWRAGHFSWRLFWPFAVLAVPLAFVGGYAHLPAHAFKVLVGVVLLFSALRFLLRPAADEVAHEPPRPVALALGGALGLLAGLTGTGGGIFLTPLLLHLRWARTQTAAAVSALFILVNSAAGLLGNLAGTKEFPPFALVLAVAAGIGGAVGSYWGSRHLQPAAIKRCLAVVLLIAGAKLILLP